MGPVWRSERLGETRGIAVARKKIADVLRKRAALNEALRQPSIRVQLSDWFSVEPGFTAADLIGGLADEEGTQQLLQSYRRGLKSAEIDERGRKRHPSVADASLFGLQIRHLVCGDDVLGKLILERDDLYDWNYEKELSSLILRPTPALVDALARITGGETWEVISAIADNLDASQCERILAWPEGPLGSGLFVRGSMNEWMAKPEGKLVYDLQGTYHVRLALQTGRHELKIGGSEWYRWNFGGTEPGKRLTLGEPLELWGSDLSSNIVLDIEVSGQYRFDVDVRSLSRLLLSCHSV
jgi:hypothetical protein